MSKINFVTFVETILWTLDDNKIDMEYYQPKRFSFNATLSHVGPSAILSFQFIFKYACLHWLRGLLFGGWKLMVVLE